MTVLPFCFMEETDMPLSQCQRCDYRERRTMIQYTEEKIFTQEQVQQLFLSVGWVFGQYPQRLHKAER